MRSDPPGAHHAEEGALFFVNHTSEGWVWPMDRGGLINSEGEDWGLSNPRRGFRKKIKINSPSGVATPRINKSTHVGCCQTLGLLRVLGVQILKPEGAVDLRDKSSLGENEWV